MSRLTRRYTIDRSPSWRRGCRPSPPKDVKKLRGRGREDIFPATQFVKPWGGITALPDLDGRYILDSRFRGPQLADCLAYMD